MMGRSPVDLCCDEASESLDDICPSPSPGAGGPEDAFAPLADLPRKAGVLTCVEDDSMDRAWPEQCRPDQTRTPAGAFAFTLPAAAGARELVECVHTWKHMRAQEEEFTPSYLQFRANVRGLAPGREAEGGRAQEANLLQCRRRMHACLEGMCRRVGFEQATLFSALNVFDRFLAGHSLSVLDPRMTPLMALASLTISAKMNEIAVPCVRDLLACMRACDASNAASLEEARGTNQSGAGARRPSKRPKSGREGETASSAAGFEADGLARLTWSFDPSHVQRMELAILNLLDWKMACITPATLLPYLLQILLADGTGAGADAQARERSCLEASHVYQRATDLLLGFTRESPEYMRYSMSELACAAAALAAGQAGRERVWEAVERLELMGPRAGKAKAAPAPQVKVAGAREGETSRPLQVLGKRLRPQHRFLSLAQPKECVREMERWLFQGPATLACKATRCAPGAARTVGGMQAGPGGEEGEEAMVGEKFTLYRSLTPTSQLDADHVFN